ncbi:hypothetical protein WJX77_005477 [Trebouxia sp. C0004]
MSPGQAQRSEYRSPLYSRKPLVSSAVVLPLPPSVAVQDKAAELSLTDTALCDRTVSVTSGHVLETTYRLWGPQPLHALDCVPAEVRPLMLLSQLMLASVTSMYRGPAQVSNLVDPRDTETL